MKRFQFFYSNRDSRNEYKPIQEEIDDKVKLLDHPCCCSNNKGTVVRKLANFALFFIFGLLSLLVLDERLATRCQDRSPRVRESNELFSPLSDRLHLEMQMWKFDDAVWPGEHPSIYRQTPSREVDEEWERISNVHNIAISSEEVIKLGKDPSKTVKAPSEWGLGNDAHLGLVNVLHETHCLDMLRRAVYYNHYYRKMRGFGDEPPEDHRAIYYSHLDHCLHYLLQTVKCNADLTITTYNWFENRTKPNPDFGTVRQCRNFESVVAWQANNHVDVGVSWEEEVARNEAFKPSQTDFIFPRKPRQDPSFWNID